MPAPKRPAADDDRTLGSSTWGDVVALLEPIVLRDSGYLPAGTLICVGLQTVSKTSTIGEYCLCRGAGEWSKAHAFPASAKCRLVSTVADRLAGRTIDTEIVKDAVGSGVPVEASGGLPGMGDV